MFDVDVIGILYVIKSMIVMEGVTITEGTSLSASKDVTVKDFIEKYLIDEIGAIKDEHPYLAFLSMAVGIEFLGKCCNHFTDWNKGGQSRNDFNGGMRIPSLNDTKYAGMDLYSELRCGLAHSLLTKGDLCLTNQASVNGAIGCDEFYQDFVAACREVLDGKVQMPVKKLTDVFFTVTDDGQGNSITGVTSTNKTVL